MFASLFGRGEPATTRAPTAEGDVEITKEENEFFA